MQVLVAYVLIGAIVILTVFLAIAAVWGIVLGVPSVPTPMAVVRVMIDLARLSGNDTVIDLGAGDGRLLIEAKKTHPAIHAVGCELNPAIWLLGKIRALFSSTRIELHLLSMLQEDLTQADVVFLYLFPEILQKLIEKFDRELKPDTRIISYMFRLPGRSPVAAKEVRGYWGEATVFVYRWTEGRP